MADRERCKKSEMKKKDNGKRNHGHGQLTPDVTDANENNI